jgi:hypothetical protein
MKWLCVFEEPAPISDDSKAILQEVTQFMDAIRTKNFAAPDCGETQWLSISK